jgi:hypothetical protein
MCIRADKVHQAQERPSVPYCTVLFCTGLYCSILHNAQLMKSQYVSAIGQSKRLIGGLQEMVRVLAMCVLRGLQRTALPHTVEAHYRILLSNNIVSCFVKSSYHVLSCRVMSYHHIKSCHHLTSHHMQKMYHHISSCHIMHVTYMS